MYYRYENPRAANDTVNLEVSRKNVKPKAVRPPKFSPQSILLATNSNFRPAMPKEHKKRGRREEKKRKDPEEQEYSEQQSKRPRQSYPYADGTVKLDTEKPYEYQYGSYPAGTPDDHTELERSHQYSYEESTAISGDAEAGPTTFYGLLDEDELAYFKSADQTLEANLFADAEEKGLFISSVWREANGNELKLANTQSCSRFLEKIIRLSSPAQLKSLFAKFSGQYDDLLQIINSC